MLLWLTAVWVGLWGSITPANVLGGLVVGAVVLRLLPVEDAVPQQNPSPVGVLRFAGVFAVALVQSSLQVLVLVLRPRVRPRQAVIAVPVHGDGGDRLLTLVANSISLTPGTLTLEVDRDRRLLHVHCLDVGEGAEGLAAVRRSIERLERAAGRALGGHP